MAARSVRRLAWALGLAALGACSEAPTRFVAPRNAPPTLELDPLAVVILDGQRVYRAKWRGADADGRIARYRFALDPADPSLPDATWQITSELEHLIFVPPESGDGTHVFTVVAEDDRGARSGVQSVAFSRHNVAPQVVLTTPPPSQLGGFGWMGFATLSPRARIGWSGIDADSGPGARPVSYRYRLFPSGSPEYRLASTNPDSIRALHAPGFFGWHQAPGESLRGVVELSPGAFYILAVTGFDAYGDYDPVFAAGKNLALVTALEPEWVAPTLTVFGASFSYVSWCRWPAGSDSTPPRLDIPVGVRIPVHWSATATTGADPVRFRHGWIAGPSDTTWSPWGNDAGTDLAIDHAAHPRRFLVEARDDFGGSSMVVLDLVPLAAAFDKPLLVVMDTRFAVDMRRAGTDCVDPPSGPWPTAAELDTFLFARGGVPWRCRDAGLVTPPGIFAGYDFDTIGTRALGATGIPLATLARYRHVVWIVNPHSGHTVGRIDDPARPGFLLRHLSGPHASRNVLAAYAELGGSVWLLGGGGGDAATRGWNVSSNDVPTIRYSSDSSPPELQPGRLMWDLAGWRSSFRLGLATGATRALGRLESDPAPATLPPVLQLRTSASDPLPGRDAQYPTRLSSEFLEAANAVELEGAAAIDSLYAVTLLNPPAGVPLAVAMTIQRRPGSTFVFSGFDVWSFRRTDGLALVDYVLGRVWGLARRGPS
jgi:hypothetical protein